jgi:hypothetical protein
MRRKGEQEGGKRMVPRIEVDDEGRLKHAFCTKDGKLFDVWFPEEDMYLTYTERLLTGFVW